MWMRTVGRNHHLSNALHTHHLHAPWRSRLYAPRNRDETLGLLRWVSTETLVDVVTDALDQSRRTGEPGEVVEMCRLCLKSVEAEAPDSPRACLLKSALSAWLCDWGPDHAWTQEQCAWHAKWLDDLQEHVQLAPLTAERIDQLPQNRRDAVLSVAVQQAAASPHWLERLSDMIDLCGTLQKSGGAPALAIARSLLNCLDQSLAQLQEGAVGHDAPERLYRIGCRFQAVLMEQVRRSSGQADLSSAAAHVGADRKEAGEQFNWTCEQDVLLVLKNRLRLTGLAFTWDSLSFIDMALAPSVGRAPQGESGQLVEVVHAYLMLQKMGIAGAHPLSMRLQRFMIDGASSSSWEVHIRAQALSMSFDSEMPPSREAFLNLHAADFASRLSLCIERTDPLDALAPLAYACAQNAPVESSMGWATFVARYLRDRPGLLGVLRDRMVGRATAAAKRWMAVLAFAQFCIDGGRQFMPLVTGYDTDEDVCNFLSHMERSADHGVWKDFFCELWVSSVVNGALYSKTAMELLWGGHGVDSRAAMVFDAERLDALLPLLNPRWSAELTVFAQKRLVQRHVIRMSMTQTTLFNALVAKSRDAGGWPEESLRNAALSVEEALRHEAGYLKGFVGKGGKGPAPEDMSLWTQRSFLDIAERWAAIAKDRPDWLEAQAVEHPWLPEVVRQVSQPTAYGEKLVATLQPLRQAAVERNFKDSGR